VTEGLLLHVLILIWEEGVEDVQGDDFNFVVFWMGTIRSPMGVTRQWWVLSLPY